MLAPGVYPEIALADARARRDEVRKLLANGIDSGDKKKNDKVEQSKARTFKEVAIEWHGTNKKWSEDHAGVCATGECYQVNFDLIPSALMTKCFISDNTRCFTLCKF